MDDDRDMQAKLTELIGKEAKNLSKEELMGVLSWLSLRVVKQIGEIAELETALTGQVGMLLATLMQLPNATAVLTCKDVRLADEYKLWHSRDSDHVWTLKAVPKLPEEQRKTGGLEPS